MKYNTYTQYHNIFPLCRPAVCWGVAKNRDKYNKYKSYTYFEFDPFIIFKIKREMKCKEIRAD